MTTRSTILDDIQHSAETNSVLKIKLKNVANPLITAVEKVEDKQIILKPTCLYGYEIAKRSIDLSDIESVSRHKTRFNHPVFERLRFIRKHISEIRNNFEGFSDQGHDLIKT